MRDGRRPMRPTAVLVVLFAAILGFANAGSGTAAGTPHLDKNLGLVVQHPAIHNLFWDTNWDADNPAFTIGGIGHVTNVMATSNYLSFANQYGVGSGSFVDFHVTGSLCGPDRAPATTHFLDVASWVTCMVTFGGAPLPSVPPVGSGGVISNDLYVVYLPRQTAIDDTITVPPINIAGHVIGGWVLLTKHSCRDYGAYHWISTSATGPFAFAVVPVQCAQTIRDVGDMASHEVIEAATDPAVTLGWIDDSQPLPQARLTLGEAADICNPSDIQVSDVFLSRYWSNNSGSCLPFLSGPLVPPGPIGAFRFEPKAGTVAATTYRTYTLSWTHPVDRRRLQSLELRVRSGAATVLQLRWKASGDSFAVKTHGKWSGPVAARSARILEAGAGKLDVAGSSSDAVDGKTVKVRIRLALARSGLLAVDARATDILDRTQKWAPAGTIRIGG